MAVFEILPHFSCMVMNDEDLKAATEQGYCEIYIFSKTGLFRRTQLSHGRSVTIPCPSLPGQALPDIKLDVASFFPAGRPPMKMLHQIVNFFREVMKGNNGANLEAQAFILWNPTQGYFIKVPEQTVSAGSVKYKAEDLLGPDDVIVVDVHSHNSMGEYISALC